MSQAGAASWEDRCDKLFRAIRDRFADRITFPLEVRLWGDRIYRFGKGEPVIKILVKDRDGLSALSRFDELGICEAYMNGSLDVVGDMLGFVSLRGALNDIHPLVTLWRRIVPLFLGRLRTDREAIASHYEFDNEFYLLFMDPTRCYSQAVFERDAFIKHEVEAVYQGQSYCSPNGKITYRINQLRTPFPRRGLREAAPAAARQTVRRDGPRL